MGSKISEWWASLSLIGKPNTTWIQNVAPLLILSIIISIIGGAFAIIELTFGSGIVEINGQILKGLSGVLYIIAFFVIFPFIASTFVGSLIFLDTKLRKNRK